MKVISSPGVAEPAQVGKKKKRETPGFSAALSEAAGVSGITNSSSAGRIPSLLNIPGRITSTLSAEKKMMLREMEGLLDLMDRYLQEMDNPRNSLQDVHPLVIEMTDRAQAMLPFLDSLAEGDGLRDLLNRMLVTATVEAIKFNRGDYA